MRIRFLSFKYIFILKVQGRDGVVIIAKGRNISVDSTGNSFYCFTLAGLTARPPKTRLLPVADNERARSTTMSYFTNNIVLTAIIVFVFVKNMI